MKSIVRIFTLLLTHMLTTHTYGQYLKPPITIASPNAASLGQYGEVPVSLFTGLPSVDIPLYTFTEGNLQVPISLSYHASGARPDQHPGWVGMNWNLKSAGMITRTQKDMMDEYNNPDYLSATEGGVNGGYWWRYAITAPTTWNTRDYMIALVTQNNSDDFYRDTEPDEFSFNFLNYSGTFYLNDIGEWQIRSNADLKVTMTGLKDVPFTRLFRNTPYVKSFGGFTITDEAGVQYTFGGGATSTDAIEYSLPIYSQVDDWTATTWHLTTIKSVDGREINFTYGYEKGNHKYDQQIKLERKDFTCTMFLNYFYKYSETTGGGFLTPNCSGYNAILPSSGNYSGELMAPVYLESIVSPMGSVVFTRTESTELRYQQSVFDKYYYDWIYHRDSRQLFRFLNDYTLTQGTPSTLEDDYPALLNNLKWRQLDQISVYRTGQATPIEQINFTYSKDINQRLTLLSVQKKGQNTSMPPYLFSYNTDIKLPGYLTDHTDHWGFYNGNKTFNYANTSESNFNAFHSFRQPDAAYVQASILTKVVYPTGGITELYYEPHTYSKGVAPQRTDDLITYSGNPIAGGLRIKRTVNYASEDGLNPQEKQYFYVTGYSSSLNPATLPSSGVLGGEARYYWGDYVVHADNDPRAIYHQRLFSSQSVFPASSNSLGSHIGYSEVVEKLADGSYTLYKYSNFDTDNKENMDEIPVSIQSSRTIYDPYIDKSFKRGNLLSLEMKTVQDQPVRKKVNTYKALSNDFVKSIHLSSFSVCPTTAVGVQEGYAFKYYTYPYKLETETDYLYDQNNPAKAVVTSTSYRYNILKDAQGKYLGGGQVAETISEQSDGSSLSTRFKYPANFFDSGSGTPSADASALALFKMKEGLHMTGVSVEQQVWEKPAGKTTYQFLKGSITHFKEFYTNAILPLATYQYRTASPVPALSRDAKVINGELKMDVPKEFPEDTQGYEMTISFDQYDTKGNLQRYHAEAGTPFTYFGYLWGYNASLPIAEVKNALIKDIAYANFETTEQGSWSTQPAGTYSSTLAKTGKSSFTGTLSKSSLTNQTYQLSLWPLTSGSVTINAQNYAVTAGSYFTLTLPAITSLAIDTKGIYVDDVRLHPQGALMTTYTYDTLVGITSSTDANGLPTFYEYDGMNRLLNVRDQDGKLIKNYTYHYQYR